MELPNGTGSLMWSRDGRSLLAWSTGSLRRFSLDTRTSLGQPFSLLAGIGPRIEISEGRFLSSGFADLALKIATQTGVEQALDLDATVGEIRQAAPTDVSDSRAIIYRSVRMDGSSHVCVTHLDSAPPRCVGPVDLDSAAWYANGQLLYARGGSLVARAFDFETVRFSGGEQPIADGLSAGNLGGAGALTVRADKLAFAVGANAAHLVWKDQSGAETTVKALASSGSLALSADGRLLLTREGRAMVLHDRSTGGSSRLGDTAGDWPIRPAGLKP